MQLAFSQSLRKLFLEAAQEPPRQLKGFEKVSLKPGESRTVSFSLDRDALYVHNRRPLNRTHAWSLT